MLSAPLKALLIAIGGIVAAATTAYLTGALDRFIDAPPAVATQAPSQPIPAPAPQPSADATPKTDRVEQPAPQAAQPVEPSAPPAAPDAAPAQAIVAPVFDLVRVESNGSIVIAGKAAPNASVEALAGSKVIGQTKAGPEGDFAIVVEVPLAPGAYQIVLRATDSANVVAMSPETALVSIPEKPDGQVLALVEQPGQPSKLITVPEPAKAAEPVAPQPAAEQPATPAPVARTETPAAPQQEQPAPAAEAAAEPQTPAQVAAATPEPAVPAASPVAPADPSVPEPVVEVKAVEIEGNKVFVAGVAVPGALIRAYANEHMLGETRASDGGQFLVEALRDLPVGDYIVRADEIGPDGIKVVRRAQVPFRRPAGESVAAVAGPAEPAAPAPSATPLAAEAPSAVAGQPAQPLAAAPAAPASAEAPAGPAPVVTAEPLQPTDGSVIIRRGDTLWQISRRVYGRGVRYSTIYLANQAQISDPNRIWPGQIFSVPVKSNEGEAADLDAVADRKPPADAPVR